jgi:hypothetical protein
MRHVTLQAVPTSMPQVLLQEVAWDEASRGRKRQARLRAMSQHEGIGDLEHEPLFCAETALKVGVALVAGCPDAGVANMVPAWGDAQKTAKCRRPLCKAQQTDAALCVSGLPLDIFVLPV